MCARSKPYTHPDWWLTQAQATHDGSAVSVDAAFRRPLHAYVAGHCSVNVLTLRGRRLPTDLETVDTGLRFAVARAVLGQPRLLLDKPPEGLTPLICQELLRAFERMSREFGLTVVIVEQQVPEVLGHASRALVLERGAVVHAAAADELLRDTATLERPVGMSVH